MDIKGLSESLGDAIRAVFPGVLFIFLWQLGQQPITLPSGNVMVVVAAAFVLGIVVHSLIRCVFFDIIVRRVRDRLRIPNGEEECDGEENFILLRFCDSKDDGFQTYLTRRWSWVHAMASSGFILPIAVVLAEPGTYLDSYKLWCTGISLLLWAGFCDQCRRLWRLERKWVTRRPRRPHGLTSL